MTERAKGVGSHSASKIHVDYLDDLLNVRGIMIIHPSGVAIFHEFVGFQVPDPQLLSGLIIGISAMLTDVGDVREVRKRFGFKEFMHEGAGESFVVWLVEGRISAMALILRQKSSAQLRSRFISLAYQIEDRLGVEIESWIGASLVGAESTIREILSEILFFDYTYPFRIPELVEISPDAHGKLYPLAKIIRERQSKLAPQEGLYLSEIVTTAIRKLRSLSYHNLLANIIEMRVQGLLQPVDVGSTIVLEEIIKPPTADVAELPPPENTDIPIEEDLPIEEPSASLETDTIQEVETIPSSIIVEDQTNDITSTPSLDIEYLLEKTIIPSIPQRMIKDILERDLKYSERFENLGPIRSENISHEKLVEFFGGWELVEEQTNSLSGPLLILNKPRLGRTVFSLIPHGDKDVLVVFAALD